MEIQRTNNINFCASLIQRVKINGKSGYNFIKFNTGSQKDVKALENVEKLWGGKNLSGGIAEEARILGKESQIYGLTTQQNNFRNIDSSKVLGLVTTGEVTKGKATELFKIGTNPQYAYEQKRTKRSIKHIAFTMLECLRKMNGNSKFVVTNPEPQEVKFLSKVGIDTVK